MADEPPERFSISIPPSDGIEVDEIDELVDDLDDVGSRSELIRELLKGFKDEDYDYPPDDL